jgi:hypothetical protein
MNNTVDFKQKYLKYKEKYLKEKALQEGAGLFPKSFGDLPLYSSITGTEGFILTDLDKFKAFLKQLDNSENVDTTSKFLQKSNLIKSFNQGKYLQTTTQLSVSRKKIYPITDVPSNMINEDPPTLNPEFMNACEYAEKDSHMSKSKFLIKSYYDNKGVLHSNFDTPEYYNVIIKIRFSNTGYHYIKHILLLKEYIVTGRIDFSNDNFELNLESLKSLYDNFELNLESLKALKSLYDNRDKKWAAKIESAATTAIYAPVTAVKAVGNALGDGLITMGQYVKPATAPDQKEKMRRQVAHTAQDAQYSRLSNK